MSLINRFRPLWLLCSIVSAEVLRPATYTIDGTSIQPVVSLCNSNAARVRSGTKVDVCFTINPPMENRPSKSYTCESLSVERIGFNRFAIQEGKNNCMERMHSYANAVGISIETPIEFTSWYGPDISGTYESAGTLSFHLKWLQQSRPFSPKGLSEKSGSSPMSLPLLAAIAGIVSLF